MRVEDLHHKELLELDPEGGVIRFAGQRALLLDAIAMGLLRRGVLLIFIEILDPHSEMLDRQLTDSLCGEVVPA
jgi:hypothetical protein